jgi:hypothetical protein
MAAHRDALLPAGEAMTPIFDVSARTVASMMAYMLRLKASAVTTLWTFTSVLPARESAVSSDMRAKNGSHIRTFDRICDHLSLIGPRVKDGFCFAAESLPSLGPYRYRDFWAALAPRLKELGLTGLADRRRLVIRRARRGSSSPLASTK